MKIITLITVTLAFLTVGSAFANDICPCDTNSCDKPSDYLIKILEEQEGWAANNKGTRGGAEGLVYHVTTTDDHIKGSLRAGLEAACPLWIVFDINGKFYLEEAISVKSHKTLDGRGHDIRIDTDTVGCPKNDVRKKTNALVIKDRINIAIFNINFDDDYPLWREDCEGSDAIEISDSKKIWIHHNSFSRWNDGAIDANEGSDKITISWNKFASILQPVAIRDGRASFHHNLCQSVKTRCPHVVETLDSKSDTIFLHTYNNFITDWKEKDVYTSKGDNANLLSEFDIFRAGSNSEATLEGSDNNVKDGLGFGKIEFNHASIKGYNNQTIELVDNPGVHKNLRKSSRALSNITKCRLKYPAKIEACYNQIISEIEANAGNTLHNF